MTASEQMLALVEGSKNLRRLCREYETESVTVHLKELVGGAFSLYAAATIRRTGGVHVFVAEDRDAAAYLLNDLYALLDERRILFFPSSYKRSIVYGAEDAQGVVQRTAALNALRTPPAGYLALCTYPEALAERVVDAEALRRETMTVRAGDHLRPADLVEWLDESGFVRVDFVYEPGQYSQRGGIVDVFSYVESLPYRFDFFDEEVDSIRRFNISSQLSQDKLQQAEIIPNLNAREGGRVSLVEAAGDVCYWFFDADYALRRVDDLRRRMLAEADDPAGSCSTRWPGRDSSRRAIRWPSGRRRSRWSSARRRNPPSTKISSCWPTTFPPRRRKGIAPIYYRRTRPRSNACKIFSTRSAAAGWSSRRCRSRCTRGSSTIRSVSAVIPTTSSSTVTSVTASTARSGATSR